MKMTYQDTDLVISLDDEGLEISVCPHDSTIIGGCASKDDWNTTKVKKDQIVTLYQFMKANITGCD